MTIRILLTGGTIDKEYDKIHGQLVFTRSHINQMLEQARCRLDVILESYKLQDSLAMTHEDRLQILEICRAYSEDKIVISHGTDTMIETARVLADGVSGKTIALFGAMIPFTFGNSDALFNFGTALAAVQSLPHGVFVTMNGIIFPHDSVRKNREEGVFEVIAQ